MKKQQTKAAIFLKSQPVHAGEITTVLSIIDSYDKLVLCLSSDASIMPLNKVFSIWSIILHAYKDKVGIVFSPIKPLEYTHNLPEALKGCFLLTQCKKTFTHLSSVNLPVKLLPRIVGYRSVFLKAAYRQGRALDWLENNGVNSTFNTNFENKLKKEEK